MKTQRAAFYQQGSFLDFALFLAVLKIWNAPGKLRI